MGAVFKAIQLAASDAFRKRPEPPPQAPRLALGLRLGALFEVDTLGFRALAGDLRMRPPASSHVVMAHGAVELPGGASLHRFYTDSEAVLEVSVRPDGQADATRLFTHLDSVYPQSAEEWEFWIGDADGYIGYASFETKDKTAYARAWSPGDSRIAPVSLAETVEAAGGSFPSRVEHKCMLYSRALPLEKREYLMVSMEEADSAASVEFSLGVDLGPGALVVPGA
jgi:hypothetical protein